MEGKLKEKVTIIVGASSGMGAAAARLFAASGFKVILAARSSDRLQELAAELGDRATAVATDVQRREDDVLTEQTWEMMLRTNLTGAFHCTQAALPVMRRQKQGLIVYISSLAAKVPDRSGVSYQASKRGLVGLAHGTFQEEKQNGIRTSVLFPGLTDTPLVLKRPVATDPETLALTLKPEDVAAACLFVVSLPPRAYVPELVILPAGLS
jgi:NADP-dependent 3-hydroxy acid dehydrogenase YdfG